MKNQPEKSKANQTADDEIDLIALAKNLWDGRKTIIKTVLIFAVIGLAIALLSPKQYTASTTLVPQSSDNSAKLGGLSSLASIAGFNMNMNQGVTELSPQVYPQIVQSVPFLLQIMNSPFTFSEVDKPVTLYQYYTEIERPGVFQIIKKYTIGLPGVILKAIRKQPAPQKENVTAGAIHLTEDQEKVRKKLAENISLELNDKEGYIELQTQFNEPLLAAQVAEKAQQLLQEYVTNFKIEKASAQLQFIKERYADKKQEFRNAQAALAEFRDRNKNVTSALAQTELERLQNEYQLAYEVYSQLAKQLEQARIKVKEDTPVFSVIKPVTVPIEKSKPNRPLILIIWIFLGGIIGVGWVFGRQYVSTVKSHWEEV